MKDSKFGYHWIWMFPTAIVCLTWTKFMLKYSEHKSNERIKKSRKSSKEIDDLATLAGNRRN